MLTSARRTVAAFSSPNVGSYSPSVTGLSLSGTTAGNYALRPPRLVPARASRGYPGHHGQCRQQDLRPDQELRLRLDGLREQRVAERRDRRLGDADRQRRHGPTTRWAATDHPQRRHGQQLPAANYNITYATGTLTVSKAALTVAADNQSRAYGQTNPVFTITYTGFVGSDSVTNLAALPTASTTADTNSPVGTYDITLTGGSDTNYSLVLSNGTLTVTPYALTVNPDNQTRAYGDANPTLTGSLVGLENGDNITANYSTAATVTNFVGTYPITATLSDPDGKLANYTVTTNSATLTITNRAITVTAVPADKIYDGTTSSPLCRPSPPAAWPTATPPTSSRSYNSKDVLTANTLIPAGSVNDGNGGNNYAV